METAVGAGAVAGGAGAAVAAAGTPAASEAQPATSGTENVAEDDTEHHAQPERTTSPPDVTSDESPRVASTTGDKADHVPATTSPEETPVSPSKGESRVKSWFKGRFRGKSQGAADFDELLTQSAVPDTPVPDTAAKKSTETDKDISRSDSMRDVAMAGRTTSQETEDMYGDATEQQSPVSPVSPIKEEENTPAAAAVSAPGPTVPRQRSTSPSISSLSSSGDEIKRRQQQSSSPPPPPPPKAPADQPASETHTLESEESRGRAGFRQRLFQKVKPSGGLGGKLTKHKDRHSEADEKAPQLPPVDTEPFSAGEEQTRGKPKPTESSNAAEMEEEARDTFAEEKLAPPPKLSEARVEGSPRGSRERSRFTEDL